MVTLIGLIGGMYIANWLDGSMFGTWILFWALTIFHVVANYIAVTSLSLRTINMQRLWINLDEYLMRGQVLAPEQVSAKESGYSTYWKNRNRDLGKLRKVKVGCNAKDIPLANDLLEKDLELKFLQSKSAYWYFKASGEAFIILRSNYKVEDILRSFVEIAITSHNSSSRFYKNANRKEFIELLREKHWKTQELFLSIGSYRFEWEKDKKD